MKFFGRIAAAIVIGWLLGLVLALLLSGFALDKIGQTPAFTIPLGIVIAYLGSFLIVRPTWPWN